MPKKDIRERFDAYVPSVPDENGCLIWTGGTYRGGYGALALGGRTRTSRKAHRLAWEFANGPIPDGMFVCHRCDVPRCVNVEHLFLGTPADNNVDRDAKGRTRYLAGEQRGPNVTRLTAAAVLEIRARYGGGGVSQSQLAGQYGVARTTIADVVCRRTWAHI